MTHEPSYVALGDEQFLQSAVGIVERGRDQGVALRLLGSLAVYAHSKHAPECIALLHSVGRVEEGRPLFTDLDLMAYPSQSRKISGIFDSIQFKPDEMVNGLFGDRRLIYYEATGKFHVDVFLGKLEFSHDVEFGQKPGQGRLELDFPTITLTDVVLEKLQIHEIARKDLIDLIVLFLGHDVVPNSSDNREVVDGSYIAGLMADDWGFWYESMQNLNKTRQQLDTFLKAGRISPEYAERVGQRIARLETMLQQVPKSRRWEKRARTGTRKPWFREVEEVVR
jgi:hypothetical protein